MSILKDTVSGASGLLGSAGSFLGGAKVWLIVLGLSVAVAGAGGWYAGSTHEAKIMANAAVSAAEKARKDQSDKDGKDWAAAKADYEARLKVSQAGEAKYKDLYDNRKRYVPNPTHASVSADAMKALNDPELVGDTQ